MQEISRKYAGTILRFFTMNDRLTDGSIRRLIFLLREHLDFLDEMGLNEKFDGWLDHRYGGIDAICHSSDETQDCNTRTAR
jgi:hypothetical protein